MAGNSRELKALITLAGQVDPSLQSAMLQATNASGKAAGRISNDFKLAGKSVGSFASDALRYTAAFLSVRALIQFGKQSLELASDLEEVQNVVDVTFGHSAQVIDEFASASLQSFGLSTLEAKQYTGTLGSMLKSMSLTDDEVVLMSQNLTALAGDMRSFHNLSGDEAFAKIRSGISGETEPLKQLGINMSVANLEAYALSQGITTQFRAMSQGEQAMLRYNYLMSAAADVQGDFARNEESYANQSVKLKGNIQELSATIASGLTPVLAEGMVGINGFLGDIDPEAIRKFTGQVGELGLMFMPLVTEVFPMAANGAGKLLPLLIEGGKTVIPPLIDGIGLLGETFGPILDSGGRLLYTILPPLGAGLRGLMPIVDGFGHVFTVAVVMPIELATMAIQGLLDLWDGFQQGIDNFKSRLGDGSLAGAVNDVAMSQPPPYLPTYALGGFANRPSIFGEAGLEAAIPIQPGNPRSVALLYKTASLLGISQHVGSVDEQRSDPLPAGRPSLVDKAPQLLRRPLGREADKGAVIRLTYAPVIHTNDPDAIEPAVKRGAIWFRQMLDEYSNNKGRLCWD